MRTAIGETDRRRAIQVAYNEEHGITPETIVKGISDITEFLMSDSKVPTKGRRRREKQIDMAPAEIEQTIVELEEEMLAAAEELRFEYAAKLRDEIRDLRRELDAATAPRGRLAAVFLTSFRVADEDEKEASSTRCCRCCPAGVHENGDGRCRCSPACRSSAAVLEAACGASLDGWTVEEVPADWRARRARLGGGRRDRRRARVDPLAVGPAAGRRDGRRGRRAARERVRLGLASDDADVPGADARPASRRGGAADLGCGVGTLAIVGGQARLGAGRGRRPRAGGDRGGARERRAATASTSTCAVADLAVDDVPLGAAAARQRAAAGARAGRGGDDGRGPARDRLRDRRRGGRGASWPAIAPSASRPPRRWARRTSGSRCA